MTKIAYLSASVIPSRSANSIHVMRMSSAFVRNGNEVDLFCCDSEEKKTSNIWEYYGTSPTFKVKEVKWPRIRGIGGFIYAIQIRKLLMSENYDLIYARDVYSAAICTSTGIPTIYESHSPPANFFKVALEKKILFRKNQARLVVISEALKEEYNRLMPNLKDIVVAHDGADDVSGIGKNITKLNNSGRLQVGYTGHLYQGRGIDIIIALAHECPWADFHLVGGNAEDLDYWQRQCKNFENIHFHGFVPPKTVAAKCEKFDILIAPYQWKVTVHGGGGDTSKWMSPLKIFEYMALGKPILVSRLPVLEEILFDGHNCIMCTPDDLKSWVEGLNALAQNGALRQRLASAARASFEEKHTWGKRAKLVLSGFQ